MSNNKKDDFYSTRSKMLEKYNVGSGTSSKQYGQKSGVPSTFFSHCGQMLSLPS